MTSPTPTEAEITTDDGVAIAYDVTGSGPVLVLVHGITESRHSWDPLLADLAADHTVVRVDLRGHGRSGSGDAYDPIRMAADVAAVVAAAGLADPVVVGHSLGGIVATAYAATQPCRGVVDVDQPLALGDFQELVRSAEPALRSDAFADVLGVMFESMKGPRLSTEEDARLVAIRQPRQDVVLGVWGPLLELDAAGVNAMVASFTATVSVPFLALHGGDPGDDYRRWLEAAIPTASVEVWDDHGHHLHLVDPDRFTARVRDFEAEVAGR